MLDEKGLEVLQPMMFISLSLGFVIGIATYGSKRKSCLGKIEEHQTQGIHTGARLPQNVLLQSDGWSQFWATSVPKVGPREKLPFELQSTTYSSKPRLAISLIIF